MGQDTSKHDIQMELARVKGYMSKVKAAEKPGEKPENKAGIIIDKVVAEQLLRRGVGEGNQQPVKKMTEEAVDSYLESINDAVESVTKGIEKNVRMDATKENNAEKNTNKADSKRSKNELSKKRSVEEISEVVEVSDSPPYSTAAKKPKKEKGKKSNGKSKQS